MNGRIRALALAAVVTAMAGSASAFGCVAQIQFDFGSAALTAGSRTVLDRIATYYPGARMTIAAHADAPGSEFENLVISRRRAEAIQGYLEARGAARILVTSAFAQTELVVADHGPNRANRRATISIASCSPKALRSIL